MGSVVMDMIRVLPADMAPATSTPKKIKLEDSSIHMSDDVDSTLCSLFPDGESDTKENDSDDDSLCDDNDVSTSKKPGKVRSVARRNERERNRVKHINRTFTILRQHIPAKKANKKLSKVDTLRSAVQYIKQLQQMIDEHDTMTMAYNQAFMIQNQPMFTLPGQRINAIVPHMHTSQAHVHHQHVPMYNIIDPLAAVGASTPTKPTNSRIPSVSSSVSSAPSPISPTSSVFSAASPSYSSDSSWEALAPGEADELLHFTKQAMLELSGKAGW